MARSSTSSRMPSSLRKSLKLLPRWVLLLIVLQIKFFPFLCQLEIFVRRLLRLLNEAVQQDNLFFHLGEEGSRDTAMQSRTDLPQTIAKIVHERFADRPCILNRQDV